MKHNFTQIAEYIHRKCLNKKCIRKCFIFGIVFFLGFQIFDIFIGTNKHWVIVNEVYRSAQLSQGELEKVIQEKNIKTVINLRGCSYPQDWYMGEAKSTLQTNISQEDITLSASRFPAPSEIRRLVEVLDHTMYPILIHCRRGSDRTGLVSGIVCLLQPNSKIEEARWHCSIRYGHFRALGTARVDEFFDFYENWLQEIDASHTPELFRRWMLNEYKPGVYYGKIEIIDFPQTIQRLQTIPFQVKVTNLSRQVWHLHSGTYAGIHLRYIVRNTRGDVLYTDRAGLLEKSIQPQESMVFQLGIPPLREVGEFSVALDLIGPNQISFVQSGGELLIQHFRINE